MCYIKALKWSRMQTFCTLVCPCRVGWSKGGAPGSGWTQPQTSKLEATALLFLQHHNASHTSFNLATAFLWTSRASHTVFSLLWLFPHSRAASSLLFLWRCRPSVLLKPQSTGKVTFSLLYPTPEREPLKGGRDCLARGLRVHSQGRHGSGHWLTSG